MLSQTSKALANASHTKPFAALFSLLTCFSLSCGQIESPQNQLKIFGGQTDAQAERYPSLLRVIDRRFGRDIINCSAVAIGGPFVLSAAHCFRTDTGPIDRQTVYSQIRLESPFGDTYKIIGTVASSYTFTTIDKHLELLQGSDLAVLKLDRDFAHKTATLLRPDEFQQLLQSLGNGNDAGLETAGFGYDNFTFGGGKLGTLHFVPSLFRETISQGTELHLGNSGRTVCLGDSGGGSFVRIGTEVKLLGITSRFFQTGSIDACGGETDGHIVANIAHIENQNRILDAIDELRPLTEADLVGPSDLALGIFAIPGTLEAENYFSAYDLSPDNVGNNRDYQPNFRNGIDFGVDLYSDNKGIVVGATEKAEVLRYRIRVKESREYLVSAECSRDGGVFDNKGAFSMQITSSSGAEVWSHRFDKVEKRGWSQYKTYELGRTTLSPGVYTLEVTVDVPVNFDRFKIL